MFPNMEKMGIIKQPHPGEQDPKNSAPVQAFSQSLLEQEESNIYKAGKIFEANNIKFEVVSIDENHIYTKALLPESGKNPKNDTVRVYRGINNLDSILEQKAYPFRFKKYESLGIEDKQKIDDLINTLSEQTTYENLANYIEIVSPFLDQSEKNTLNYETRFIENSILSGFSCRRSLHQNQISHPMGNSTFGLSPYISTSYETSGAYGGEAVLVLDVPISAMEDWSPEDDGEANLKGMFQKEYVGAVLLRDNTASIGRHDTKIEIQAGLKQITELLPKLDSDKIVSARAEKHAKLIQSDLENARSDKRAVELSRVNNLLKNFDVTNSIRAYFEENKDNFSADIYKNVQEKIYEEYERRYDVINPNSPLVQDEDFSKQKLDDKLLERLKHYVDRLEEREKGR